MPLVYTPSFLSGSTNGRPIEVSAVASPGDVIHTVQSTGTAAREEIVIDAYNDATATVGLVIEFGSTATSDRLVFHLPSQLGLIRVIDRLRLTATTSIVRAFSTGTATETLRLAGFTDRAT